MYNDYNVLLFGGVMRIKNYDEITEKWSQPNEEGLKKSGKEPSSREDLLEDVARRNEQPIVVNGHLDCDESSAVWVTSNAKFARFTIGEVRRKREELEIENER